MKITKKAEEALAATDSPWPWYFDPETYYVYDDNDNHVIDTDTCSDGDARFIAEAPTLVRELTKTIFRRDGELDRTNERFLETRAHLERFMNAIEDHKRLIGIGHPGANELLWDLLKEYE